MNARARNRRLHLADARPIRLEVGDRTLLLVPLGHDVAGPPSTARVLDEGDDLALLTEHQRSLVDRTARALPRNPRSASSKAKLERMLDRHDLVEAAASIHTPRGKAIRDIERSYGLPRLRSDVARDDVAERLLLKIVRWHGAAALSDDGLVKLAELHSARLAADYAGDEIPMLLR